MKKVLAILAFAALLVVVGFKVRAQAPITHQPKEDQQQLRAINAELQLMQERANPLMNERVEIYKRDCGLAKIPLESCQILVTTGEISRIPAAPTVITTPKK